MSVKITMHSPFHLTMAFISMRFVFCNQFVTLLFYIKQIFIMSTRLFSLIFQFFYGLDSVRQLKIEQKSQDKVI